MLTAIHVDCNICCVHRHMVLVGTGHLVYGFSVLHMKIYVWCINKTIILKLKNTNTIKPLTC